MLEKIKSFFRGIAYLWNNLDRLTDVYRYIKGFPGLEDSQKLRLWLRPLLFDVSSLTSLTKNTIDDTVIMAAIRILDNDLAWNAIYSQIQLLHNWPFRDGVLIPQGELRNDTVEAFYDVTDQIPDINPTVIIAAIGLILELVQLIAKFRK